MTKNELRKYHQALRRAMTRSEVLTGSKTIASKIMAMDSVVKSDVIFS